MNTKPLIDELLEQYYELGEAIAQSLLDDVMKEEEILSYDEEYTRYELEDYDESSNDWE